MCASYSHEYVHASALFLDMDDEKAIIMREYGDEDMIDALKIPYNLLDQLTNFTSDLN
jgi:hypothetical protein